MKTTLYLPYKRIKLATIVPINTPSTPILFDNKIDNKDLPQGGTKYIINGIEYSRGQIQNCEFDESSSQECYFANVSH